MRTKAAPKKKTAGTLAARGKVKKSTQVPERFYNYNWNDSRLGLTPWTQPGEYPVGATWTQVAKKSRAFSKGQKALRPLPIGVDRSKYGSARNIIFP